MYQIEHYVTADGVDIFTGWINGVRDQRAAAKVLTRIDRLALGNFGDYRALDGGVFELRIDEGPGYRVYAARVGKVVLLLLCGGDKKSQTKDIEDAKTYLQDYKARSKEAAAAKRAP
jgi:putative addiction module killer protein